MKNNCEIDFNNDELLDYPYLGIGEKPNFSKRNIPTEEQIEKIIGG